MIMDFWSPLEELVIGILQRPNAAQMQELLRHDFKKLTYFIVEF